MASDREATPKSATIPNAATVSNPITCQEYAWGAIQFDAAWDGRLVHFQRSFDGGGTWADYRDGSGVITLTGTASSSQDLPAGLLGCERFRLATAAGVSSAFGATLFLKT